MRILVVGSGGREHALAAKIGQSALVDAVFVAPGNAGTALIAHNVPVAAEDIAGLVAFARSERIDLVIPGPEAPLVLGLADRLAEIGIACCGPSAAAAALEGSKTFCKEICDQAGIPTAAWRGFTDADAARAYVRQMGAPIVVKADGLAAGKGVVVAQSVAEAEAAIGAIMEERVHGGAGAAVVIEECMTGAEISVFALCDGLSALYLGAAADHKRVGDGDTGPNTGGMGAIAPPPGATDEMIATTMTTIIRPALAAMVARGTPFRGFLFAGLMLTATGPRLIEFNVRFGDPECETLLPLLRSDLVPALMAACDGTLAHVDLRWSAGASATVIMAARGYPGAYQKGSAIAGLDQASALEGVTIYHAATKSAGTQVLADGGRVLAVNATGPDLQAAIARAYRAVDAIDWPGGFCRRDIGANTVKNGTVASQNSGKR